MWLCFSRNSVRVDSVEDSDGLRSRCMFPQVSEGIVAAMYLWLVDLVWCSWIIYGLLRVIGWYDLMRTKTEEEKEKGREDERGTQWSEMRC